MAKNDKAKPIEERIAALLGRTAYCDLRDGMGGGTSPLRIKDSDVAAALGMVSERKGAIAAWVLETHYGSTLMHKPRIMKSWEEQENMPGEPRERTCLTRFGGELAIRELAGLKYSTTQIAEFAYLIVSRRETLHDRVRSAGSWLEGIRSEAMLELRRVMRETCEFRRAA